MIRLVISLLLLVTFCSYGQESSSVDSVEVRVHNNGKYKLVKYVVTVEGKGYVFPALDEGEYSPYQRLPYLYSCNKSKTTLLIKKFFARQYQLTILSIPVDNVGEEKITSGRYVIEILTRKQDGMINLFETIEE